MSGTPVHMETISATSLGDTETAAELESQSTRNCSSCDLSSRSRSRRAVASAHFWASMASSFSRWTDLIWEKVSFRDDDSGILYIRTRDAASSMTSMALSGR